ncbi:hypothetical protein DRP07_10750 [Archaeoglobales archaeon]|nr:MAG: hypothetical protein DRP07_10750 [Archaeoglobales archaeon]
MVILLVSTKHRWLNWNWRRIVKACVKGTAIFVGVVGFSLAIIYVAVQFTQHHKRPQRISQLWGIRLGTTKDDVLFLKGTPSEVDGDSWKYYLSDGYYTIGFDNNSVRYIIYTAKIGKWSHPSVNGITIGSTSGEVIDRLGVPPHIERSKSGLSRFYIYDHLNLILHLERNQVVSFGIGEISLP